MSGHIQQGVNAQLEEAADQFIKDSFTHHPDADAKALILTRWMLATRLRREVYTTDGTPDAAVRRGLFHRAYNPAHPHLNAVEGVAARPKRFQHMNNGPDE